MNVHSGERRVMLTARLLGRTVGRRGRSGGGHRVQPPDPQRAGLPAHPPGDPGAAGRADGRLLGQRRPRGRAQQRARRAQRRPPGAAGHRCASRCWSAGTTPTGSPTTSTSGSTSRRSSRPAGRVGGPRRPVTPPARWRRTSGPAQLYDGDFLADDPYSPWAGELRETLRAQADDVACRLVALYGRLGDDSSAVLVGRRVLAGDPCNEPVHRQLMASYARTGQRHLALLQYQRCRQALWTTFRIHPAVETTVLYESLRGRLPQPAVGERERSWRPTTTCSAPRARPVSRSSVSRAADGCSWSTAAPGG